MLGGYIDVRLVDEHGESAAGREMPVLNEELILCSTLRSRAPLEHSAENPVVSCCRQRTSS